MKNIESLKIIICISVLFSINTLIHSQSKQILSTSVNAGIFTPLDLLSERINSGFRIGFDFESRNQNFGVYLSANFNIAMYKNTTENLNKDMTAAIYEIDIGPRWYIGKTKKVQGNIDLGFSAFTGNYVDKLKFGLSAAVGLNVPLNKKLVINTGSRISLIGIDYFQLYATVFAGVRYNF